jgi:chemotaxis protein CheD
MVSNKKQPSRRIIAVNTGCISVSNSATDELVAFALGPCIGMAIHDHKASVGGMAHIRLPATTPNSRVDSGFDYADCAIPELIKRAEALGAVSKRLRVVIAGGASMLDSGYFQIGRKNFLAVKKILWQLGFFVSEQAVGGTEWRTLRLSVGSGQIILETSSRCQEM